MVLAAASASSSGRSAAVLLTHTSRAGQWLEPVTQLSHAGCSMAASVRDGQPVGSGRSARALAGSARALYRDAAPPLRARRLGCATPEPARASPTTRFRVDELYERTVVRGFGAWRARGGLVRRARRRRRRERVAGPRSRGAALGAGAHRPLLVDGAVDGVADARARQRPALAPHADRARQQLRARRRGRASSCSIVLDELV